MQSGDYTREQLDAEREKLLSEARLIKSRMLRLEADEGFKYFREQLKEQIDRRMTQILALPNSADEIIQRTHAIGEIAGIKLALDYVEVLKTYAQTSIDSANYAEEQEKQNGESNTEAGSASGGTAATGRTYDDECLDGDELDGRPARSAP